MAGRFSRRGIWRLVKAKNLWQEDCKAEEKAQKDEKDQPQSQERLLDGE